MVFVSPSREDRERRKKVLKKLKSIVDQLTDEEHEEEALSYYRTITLSPLCSSHARSLPSSPALSIASRKSKPSRTNINNKKKSNEMRSNLSRSVTNTLPPTKEAQDEIQPEIMAALMHTDEKYLGRQTSTLPVYNDLFPSCKDDLLIKISSVAPGPLQNIVIPVDEPVDLHSYGINSEIRKIVKYTNSRTLPVENIFTKSVLKTDKVVPKLNNTVLEDKKCIGKSRRRWNKRPTLPASQLLDLSPLWGSGDLEPMINLVGASPLSIATEDILEAAEPSTIYHNRLENSLEYNLEPQTPKYVSRVQLRGTQNPPWFPGYYVALPNAIKVVKSPSEVLPAAWQAVQPDIFTDESFLFVH